MLGFAAGIAALIAALYVPGALLFRACGFSWLHAVIAAPLYGAMLVGVLPIAYYELGVSCTVLSIMGPALLIAAAAWLASNLWHGKKGAAFGFPDATGKTASKDTPDDWKLAALYVACGIAVCVVVFGMSLPTPDAAYIRYDNQTHLNVSKSFLDSGMWSSLHPNRYLGADAAANPFKAGASSFYPSLLYALSALDALMVGLPVTAAFNAALFALCAVVFPLGLFAIMRVTFAGNRAAIALGAVALALFPAFPWGVFMRGLFPNVAGFCLMAPAVGSTMALLSARMEPRTVARGAVLWACALPALGLAQPNAVFAAFVFLAAYAAHIAGDRWAHAAKPGTNPRTARCLGALAVIAVALAIWTACLNLPFMRSVVGYFGNTVLSPAAALGHTLLLAFTPFPAQPLLLAVIVMGIVSCVRNRTFWVLGPALFMAVSYTVIRIANTPIAHFLAGFWYCDHVRIAAALSIFLMPLAAIGLAGIAHAAFNLAHRAIPRRSNKQCRAAAATAILLACALMLAPDISFPGSSKPLLKTEFGEVYASMHDMYRESDNKVYGNDEQEFVDRAREITGSDLVLNYPADGSSFAYAVNNMNVYFRTLKAGGQTKTAKAIRTKLDEYASDPAVRERVDSTGARWLLKLDQGVSYEDGRWFRQYTNPKAYAGIERAGDGTPGFTVVLSEGDMRLYRIDAGC